ncbi:hypothetical protein B0A54_05672 [Friedmanniomyces endolithicus]|uniref:Glucosidase 2 subunit beta n=1 Tax=Friedmanniomyces endolithicus TaxID=329885 RepID=A0A4U0V5A7_9PEZI|nr:hypothetical protein B0A54_05672 [Friedmanniomyces endolithicus]
MCQVFYKDDSTFSCISTPSITLPLSRLNDDYCDCPDGSDEPGTSACSHLSPLSLHTPVDHSSTGSNISLSLPGFYCKNKGHVPTYVPFTNVNDGICDYTLCCDGSEEWDHVGGVKCEDRCQQIGKEFRKLDEARQKSLGSAGRKRKELVVEAGRLRREVQNRLQSLGTEIEGSEMKVKQLEAELVEVERREKGKVVRSAVQKVGKMGELVGLAKQRSEELRETLERVREERDASRGRVQELEGVLMTFKEEYNPNFNDEGVKRAVRAWEEYAARDKGPEPDAAHDRDLDAITQSDKDNGLDWAEYEGEGDEESDGGVLYAFENYLPSPLRTWLDTNLRTLRTTLIDSGILADTTSSTSSTSSSTTESKAVQAAQSRLDAARSDLANHHKSLTSHKEDLDSNMGPDDIFRALKGQCIATDSGEYTYEFCFLDKTTQKPKKGGGHTNMGNFVRMETVFVDEDVDDKGKGLGKGERIAMRFEGGQHCWNGPSRSTVVVLGCAEVGEVWRIMEEEKCVYRMEVGTPAVCDLVGMGGGGSGGGGIGGRDEL